MQMFEVRLLVIGANPLPVLARIRPLLGRPPAESLDLARRGSLAIATNLLRTEAEDMAAMLRGMGAEAEIVVCDDGCCESQRGHGERCGEPLQE